MVEWLSIFHSSYESMEIWKFVNRAFCEAWKLLNRNIFKLYLHKMFVMTKDERSWQQKAEYWNISSSARFMSFLDLKDSFPMLIYDIRVLKVGSNPGRVRSEGLLIRGMIIIREKDCWLLIRGMIRGKDCSLHEFYYFPPDFNLMSNFCYKYVKLLFFVLKR